MVQTFYLGKTFTTLPHQWSFTWLTLVTVIEVIVIVFLDRQVILIVGLDKCRMDLIMSFALIITPIRETVNSIIYLRERVSSNCSPS